MKTELGDWHDLDIQEQEYIAKKYWWRPVCLRWWWKHFMWLDDCFNHAVKMPRILAFTMWGLDELLLRLEYLTGDTRYESWERIVEDEHWGENERNWAESYLSWAKGNRIMSADDPD